MNPAPVTRGEGESRCLSDFLLDAFDAQVAREDERLVVEQHLPGCVDCLNRLARIRSGFDAFPQVDDRAILAGIRRGVAQPAQSWGSWLQYLLAPLAVAGVAGLILVVHPHDGESGRTKGGPQLRVFRQAQDLVREMISGDRFKSGDRLRFAVDLQARSRVQIIGIEQSGRLYSVWPTTEAALLPAGKAQSVPAAVELDESSGTETLYLVACPPEQTQPACATRGAAAAPLCQPGCVTNPFVLSKGP